jgi:hypothetical protein
MDTFTLSRNFTNWAFENPEKIHPNHYAIYFFAIEHCNRLGGKEKFGFPSQMTMEAIGIRKHQTYIKYFNDLIEFKFFKLIEKSRNQYSANIISLVYAMPKKGKALDKANIKHKAKQTESEGQSSGNIDKQINNEQVNNLKEDIVSLKINELSSDKLKELLFEYVDVRKSMNKPLTSGGITLILKFLKKTFKDYNSNELVNEIVITAIDQKWQSMYLTEAMKINYSSKKLPSDGSYY